MTEVERLKNSIKNKYIDISNAYVESEFRNNTFFREDFPNTITAPSNKLSTFVDALFSQYSTFRDMYLKDADFYTDVDIQKIKYRDYSNPKSTYTTVQPSSLISIARQNDNITSIKEINASIPADSVEINFSEFIRPNSDLANHMNSLRRLYGILEETNYQKYLLLNRNKLNSPSCNVVTLYDGKTDNIHALNAKTELPKYYSLFDEIRNSTLRTNVLVVPGSSLNVAEYPGGNNTYPTAYLPEGIIGDKIYHAAPNSSNPNAQSSSVTSKLRDSIGVKGKTMYYTLSMWVCAREAPASTTPPTLADKPTVNIALELQFQNKDVAAFNVQFSESTTTTAIRGKWKKLSITRALSVPPRVTPSVELRCKLSVLHPNTNSDAKTYAILVTGLQLDETDSLTNPSVAYKVPEFDDTTNRTVVRRLILMYELMATYYMSVRIMEKQYDDKGLKNKYARSIAFLVDEYVSNFNNNVLKQFQYEGNDNTNTLIGHLSKNVNNRFNDYRDKYTLVQSTTSSINNLKDTMHSNIDELNGQQNKNKSMSTLNIIATVLATIVIVACAVVYMMPIEGSKKFVATAGVILLGLSVMVTFRWIIGSKIENFQAFGASTVVSKTILVKDAQEYNLDFADTFLQNTINIALIMQTYNTYGAVNFALNKESTYFTNIKSQIDLSSQKISNVKDAYSLEDYSSRARISFLINITIVVALTIGIAIAADSVPGLRAVVLGIGCVAIILVITMYMVDVSRRVRTAGEKIYWKQPSNPM